MTYRAWDLKTLDRAAVRELTHAIAEQRTEELEYSAMDEEPWSEQKYAATLAAQQTTYQSSYVLHAEAQLTE